MARWKTRGTDNCLFIDETESGRIVLQHNARPGMRPYIHPLRGIDGQACLTEDSPWHHPWQHGIQTGFHGVNGCDFWFDPGQNAKAVIGTIEPQMPEILEEDPPSWSIDAVWRHSDGSELMKETQSWSLSEGEEVLCADAVQIGPGGKGGQFDRAGGRRDGAAGGGMGRSADAGESRERAGGDYADGSSGQPGASGALAGGRAERDQSGAVYSGGDQA